jgi:alpha-glucosidase
MASMREVHAGMPWTSWAGSTSHLDSHDTPRFRAVAGGGTGGWVDAKGVGRDRHLLGVALLMTLPGIPGGVHGRRTGPDRVDGERSRTSMPWRRPDEWDKPTLEAYRTWIALRRGNVAPAAAGLRWAHVGAESMTYLREHREQRILVHVARSPHAAARAPPAAPGCAALPSYGPAAHVYALDA